jgi:sorbitol-specific phosphotransferase system component IIC
MSAATAQPVHHAPEQRAAPTSSLPILLCLVALLASSVSEMVGEMRMEVRMCTCAARHL